MKLHGRDGKGKKLQLLAALRRRERNCTGRLVSAGFVLFWQRSRQRCFRCGDAPGSLVASCDCEICGSLGTERSKRRDSLGNILEKNGIGGLTAGDNPNPVVSGLQVHSASAVSGFCFVAGTPVLTPAGHTAIEAVRTGGKVISSDPFSFETAEKSVLRTYERRVRNLLKLTVSGELIVTTADHLFYVSGFGFKPAGETVAGDTLTDPDGAEHELEAVETVRLARLVAVYNLLVKDYHTYHVGELGILVHNSGCAE